MRRLSTDSVLPKVAPRPSIGKSLGRFGGGQFLTLLLAVGDVLIFSSVTTALSFVILRHAEVDQLQRTSLEHFPAIAFLVFIVLHSLAKSYERITTDSVTLFNFVIVPTLIAAVAVIIAFILEFLLIGVTIPANGAIDKTTLMVGLVGVPTWVTAVQRTGSRIYLHSLIAKGQLSTTVAVIGAGDIGYRLVQLLKGRYQDQIKLIGIFDDRIGRVPSRIRDLNVQGGVSDLVDFVKTNHVDKVLIALPLNAERRILDILRRLKTVPIDIALVPDIMSIEPETRSYARRAPLFLDVIHRPMSLSGRLAKRCMDLIFSALILLLFSPIMLATAIAIRLDSPGPIFFRQPRLGLSNEKIEILKFRTMHVAASDFEAREQTKRDDPRVTRVGKWLRLTSIDELPQLFNVLCGNMSLVGPRPHAVGMRVKDSLCQEISKEYAERHRVKPGITGWAQVCGLRGAVNDPEILRARIEHDIYYIDNWSILFDLKILMLTIVVVARTENAY
ncbi:undecaprenyl-phosphate glucose phosphotransferase [Dongia soli]|uniref:Undecaprenyl-phosphate glucose phosphotransferase n=1 Tax=Dongia soli TaxID=600628 RepID=A0ABU5EEB0_9PROT|nr:undecaprenyl-phosphate glucose phosphotransferase [Dongia soli]MDY0884257.1 undecaprenyl-phosphate glucose phosphotransferase [Dongia soli]